MEKCDMCGEPWQAGKGQNDRDYETCETCGYQKKDHDKKFIANFRLVDEKHKQLKYN